MRIRALPVAATEAPFHRDVSYFQEAILRCLKFENYLKILSKLSVEIW